MDRIEIERGRIFSYRWNPKKRKHDRSELKSLIPCLQKTLSKVESTTFGQFMELIARDEKLMQVIFQSSMGGFPLRDYIRECRRRAVNSKDLEYVHVYWCSELWLGGCSEYKGDNEMSEYVGFGGWGTWPKEKWMKKKPPKGGIAIEFTPLNEYKNVPFKIDDSFEISEWGGEGKPKAIVKGRKRFTVYDVVNAVLFEITWGGDPKMRDRKWKKLVKIKDEAVEQMKKGKMKKFDDLKKKLKGGK